MTEYSVKLKEFVAKSNLGREQKKLWEIFATSARPEESEAVYEAVSEEEGNLELLTKHLQEKIQEMRSEQGLAV